jgi:two-component system, OmpR family, sensor histidine kinase KdpD
MAGFGAAAPPSSSSMASVSDFGTSRPQRTGAPGMGRVAAQVLGSLGIIAGITFVGYRLADMNATTVGFAYLVAILAVASAWGLVESLVASVAAVLCFNFFFLPPLLTLTVSDPQNWAAILAFLATSVVASQLSARAKQRTREALERQQDMERLYALSRSILLTNAEEGIAHGIARQIGQTFDFPAAALYDRGTGAIYRTGPEDAPEIDDRLREAALKGTLFRDEASGTVVTAIRLGGEPIGALALRGTLPSDTVLQALANLTAIGLEKARAQEAANRAEAARESQDLKSTLLDALAHEFKTPLTSMKASTSALLSHLVAEPQAQHELIVVVNEEIDHLNRLVTEAVHVARIEAGAIQLNCAGQPLGPIVAAAVHSMESALEGRQVKVDVEAGLDRVNADAELTVLALRQLLDNALQYSPRGTPVVVQAVKRDGRAVICVSDRGPGVPVAERTRIFDKFYRGSNGHGTHGTGMGLAIARQIARAHGGEVWLDKTSSEGSEFCLSLPLRVDERNAP